MNIAVNAPKTPVTEGSNDSAPASLPNVCKMPGPPAPFVPTPLPNIGRSSNSLSDGTTTVFFEDKKVAVKGAYFMSMGDIASQGTGGGLVSSCTEGKTKFVGPGSMNVKAEGKNIQLLGDAMSNNGRNPDNSATIPGNLQPPAAPVLPKMPIDCANGKYFGEPLNDCDKKQICKKCDEVNKQADAKQIKRRTPAENKSLEKVKGDAQGAMREIFSQLMDQWGKEEISSYMYDACAYDDWKSKGRSRRFSGLDPDHIHEVQLGGAPAEAANFKWMSAGANRWTGRQLQEYHEDKYSGVEPNCC